MYHNHLSRSAFHGIWIVQKELLGHIFRIDVKGKYNIMCTKLGIDGHIADTAVVLG